MAKPMSDMVADWRRWSRAERVIALVVTGMCAALPLVMLLRAAAGI